MRAFIPSETALVLGGGGAKGAYEVGAIAALDALAISQSCSEPASISSSRFSTIASDGKRVVTTPRRTPLRRTLSSSISRCRISISGETSTPFRCA